MPNDLYDDNSNLITSTEQDTGQSSYEPTPVPPPINVSGSYSGPTAAGQQRAAGMLGQIDQRVAGYAAQDATRTDNEIEAYRNKVAAQKAAVAGVEPVNVDYEKELGVIDTKRQALFAEAARQEQEASSLAKVSSAEFVNKYQQQLAAVRALSVNIAGPLAKLSTAEMGGLSLAMFAQGFLAAQGININVGGQVDKWVERSIREQERQIQQGEAAAQDTLNLWHIARQNSADDLEARQRYRGFVIEGLKAQTEFQAARFQSRLATAQSKVTLANLDTEATINEINMAKAHEDRVFKQKQWETQTAFELARVNLESQRLQLEKDRDANRNKDQPKFQIIIDPSDGKAKWIVREDRINAGEDAKLAAKAQADYDKVDKQVKAAIEFRSKHAESTWGHLKIFDRIPEAKRQYEAMVDRLATEMSRAYFGTRASDKEFERVRKLVPFDKWYEGGDNEEIWTKYREDVRSDFDATMAAHADALPPEQQVVLPRNEANPSAKAIYDASLSGGKPVENFASSEQAKVVGKDSEDIDEGSYGSGLWRGFSSQYTAGDEFFKDAPSKGKLKSGDDAKMPGWAVAIDHLATGWAKPDEIKSYGNDNKVYIGTENDTPEEIATESKKVLDTLAKGKTPDGKKVPVPAQNYAKYILKLGVDGINDELTNNPLGAFRDYPR